MENRSAAGIIFIVDISGYSKFVRNHSTGIGATIMPLFLNALLRANDLSLRVAEIEGDAVLFYRMGKAIPVSSILGQFNTMYHSFHAQISTLKDEYPGINALSIKAVVHYGLLSGYEIGGYYKLYGKVLVEAHRLLKNHINSHTYIIITHSYFLQQQQSTYKGGIAMCEQYDIGNIEYTYFSYPEIATKGTLWLA